MVQRYVYNNAGAQGSQFVVTYTHETLHLHFKLQKPVTLKGHLN